MITKINAKLAVAIVALGIAFLPASPAFARGDHVGVFVGVGGGCCYGGPWEPYPYPAYAYPGYYPYYSYYAPPPPVVYAPPPTVVTYAPQPAYAAPSGPPPVSANQASPTYTDGQGRTCREYQSTATVGGATQPAYGTACLQPDGSWRIVQ